MYKQLRDVKIFAILLLVCLGLHSCTSLKQYRYFQDIPDSSRSINIKLPNYVTPIVQPGDVLSITILTIDPAATTPVNVSNLTVASDQVGYLVDKDGYIEMQELGKIKVANLTIAQVRQIVEDKAKIYFQNPIIIVKNKNIRVTVLGEVAKPGVVNSVAEKFSIIDLIGQVGELTNFGKRDNILLLRQNVDNTVTSVRLNLKSSNIIKSPYFYLQNNDVVYFEPMKSKAIANDIEFTRNLSYLSILTSLVGIFFILFRR